MVGAENYSTLRKFQTLRPFPRQKYYTTTSLELVSPHNKNNQENYSF